MIMKLSNLLSEGGFEKWNRFHDCMLSGVSFTSKTIVMLINDLYDWNTRKYTDGKVILILSSEDGSDVFTPDHDFFRMIYRFEIDVEKRTITGMFSDGRFIIGVDFEESFLVEV